MKYDPFKELCINRRRKIRFHFTELRNKTRLFFICVVQKCFQIYPFFFFYFLIKLTVYKVFLQFTVFTSRTILFVIARFLRIKRFIAFLTHFFGEYLLHTFLIPSKFMVIKKKLIFFLVYYFYLFLNVVKYFNHRISRQLVYYLYFKRFIKINKKVL